MEYKRTDRESEYVVALIICTLIVVVCALFAYSAYNTTVRMQMCLDKDMEWFEYNCVEKRG